MVRRVTQFATIAVVIAIVASLLVGGAAATVPRAQQGITKNEIKIALLIPDLDKYKAAGFVSGPSAQSNADFTKKFTAYVDAFGPINGRKIVVDPIPWDIIDVTGEDKACTSATQDTKPFMVVNATGFRSSAVPCITVDNRTPMFWGDMPDAQLLKASGKNLVTLGLPAELDGRGAAQVLAQTKDLPKTAKIGILESNIPSIKAAGESLASELKKQGYNVASKVQLNGLAANAGLLRQESAAAADTFQAAGVDTMFNVQSWPQMSSFLGESARIGANFAIYGIDGEANGCIPSAAAGTPANAAGATCITYWDPHTLPSKEGVKKDNAVEAQCRREFDSANTKSAPGAPSAPKLVGGVVYPGDLSVTECNIARQLLPAIKKAGKDLTWDKVYANLIATTQAPAAYMSNGSGGFGKNKPYFAAPVMHLIQMSAASAATPKDVHGMYNGCPIPANCWIPKLVNGKEWFAVKG